jgi:hypothetical protein
LLRDLRGRAAAVSRLASGAFVLCYGAWEAVAGLATGAMIQNANDLHDQGKPAAAEAIEALNDNLLIGDFGLINILGVLAWITAVTAAAIAFRNHGAPKRAWVLLACSMFAAQHPPPTGPLALLCFAAAAITLLNWTGQGSRAIPSAAHAIPSSVVRL